MIFKKKISSHVQKKWFNEWYADCIDYDHNYSYDIQKFQSTPIYFFDKPGVGDVSFPTNSVSINDPVIKASEYGMVVYFMEIPYPKFPFSQH